MKGSQSYPVITHPFGIGDAQRPNFSTIYDPTKINYPLGIPPSCSVLGKMGGTRFDRHMMNQLGYLSTFGGFLTQVGAPNTFVKSVSDAIGGYPKGTVLKDMSHAYDDANTVGKYSVIRDVVSLQDDNTQNFVYDAVENPTPYVIGSKVDGKVWWQYVEDEMDHPSLNRPNLNNITLNKWFNYSKVGTYEYVYAATEDEWLYVMMNTPYFCFHLTEKTGSTPAYRELNFRGWLYGSASGGTIQVYDDGYEGTHHNITVSNGDYVVSKYDMPATSSTGVSFTKTRYRYYIYSDGLWTEIPNIGIGGANGVYYYRHYYVREFDSKFDNFFPKNRVYTKFSWQDTLSKYYDADEWNVQFVADTALPTNQVFPLNKGDSITFKIDITNTYHPINIGLYKAASF